MEKILKFGPSVGVGFLIGLALIIWIEPTTKGGISILLLVPIVGGIIVGHICSFLIGRWLAYRKENKVTEVSRNRH